MTLSASVALAMALLAILGFVGLRFVWVRRGVARHRRDLPPDSSFEWPRDVGPDAAGVAGVEGPERSSVSRSDAAGAIADGSMAGVPAAVAFVSIDPTIVEAMDFAFRTDLTDFSELQSLVTSTAEMSPEAYLGWISRTNGYVGERIAGDVLESRGHEVLWPDHPNNPGWDFFADGVPMNPKVGDSISHIREHFQTYPDIPVITSADQAARVSEEFHDRIIVLDDLDYDLLSSQVEASFDAVLGVEAAAVVPAVTMCLAGIREYRLLRAEVTEPSTSLKNAGLDVAGTGGGGFAGAHAGALLGSTLLPGAGTVAGIILGGAAGALAGRYGSNKVKTAAWRRATTDYETVSSDVNERATKRHEEFAGEAECLLSSLREELQRDVKKLEASQRKRIKEAQLEFERTCEGFRRSFPSVLRSVERGLAAEQRAVLAGLRRSSWIRRWIWPTEEDLWYRAVQRWFDKRRRLLREAASQFENSDLQANPQEKLARVQEYLQRHQIDHPRLTPTLEVVYRHYQHAVTTAQAARVQAAEQVRSHLGRFAARFQEAMISGMHELGADLERIRADLTAARDRVVAEGAKLGFAEPSEQRTTKSA